MTKNFRISVNQLPAGERQAEVMNMVAQAFDALGKRFFVIGATARDIIALMLNAKPKRKTNDLDITVAIDDWSEFETIKAELEERGFRPDRTIQQRLYLGEDADMFEVDIVPFGKVADPDHQFSWPGEDDTLLSVDGFESAVSQDNTITVSVDDYFSFEIPNAPSLFILKLFAWNDRSKHYVYKDATDMDFLIRSYYLPNVTEERMMYVYDRVKDNDGCDYVWGAAMMATDVVRVASRMDLIKLEEIVRTELSLGERSKLLTYCLSESFDNNEFDRIRAGWSYFQEIIKESLNVVSA